MQIYDDLKNHSQEKGPIRIGLIGAGFMGKGIVEVIEYLPGMEVAAVSDTHIDRAVESFRGVGISDIRKVINLAELGKVNLSRERVVCSNPNIITDMDKIDMVIEATGQPEVGAEVAHRSVMHKKHIGMLNVETDATIGYYLSMLARRMGVVYTVCSGDEPACVKELYDFAKICGFTVIAVGKGKNNPLDVYATPQTLADKAAEIGLNPHILTEFVDGTKTMIEMCCVANADGLRVDRRNMHGPRVTLEQLTEVFALREKGGILGREGIVDYVIGDVAPGVFVVVRHEGRIANETMRYLKIGKGPNYLLYRPYHLTNLEVPHTIAWAMLYGKASLATTSLPTTEVITIAKQDLREGERIDCLGGNMVYGGLENREISERENLLPLGLSIGAKLMEDVARGTPLTYRQVSLRDSWILKFRKLQDSMHE